MPLGLIADHCPVPHDPRPAARHRRDSTFKSTARFAARGLAWLYDSNFAPWLVQTIRALPLATLILWPALASVPQVMLDTAATDGTGWWGQLLRIALPQRWPAVAAAWLIALAIAVGELAATVLVMPPQRGATALSIQMFQLLHYGVDDRVAAICLVMVFAIAALTGIAAVLLQRKTLRQPMSQDERRRLLRSNR